MLFHDCSCRGLIPTFTVIQADSRHIYSEMNKMKKRKLQKCKKWNKNYSKTNITN